jgi:hypothetical protein
MFKKPIVKKILMALAVAVFGFVLLNLTFLFNYLMFLVIDLFVPPDFIPANLWFPLVRHGLFLVIICLISWFVFRSNLGVLYKAIFLTVPVAVFIVSIGIFLYKWPPIPYIIGGLSTLAILFYFYRTKQHWLYYYSVLFIALALMIFTLLGGEI